MYPSYRLRSGIPLAIYIHPKNNESAAHRFLTGGGRLYFAVISDLSAGAV